VVAKGASKKPEPAIDFCVRYHILGEFIRENDGPSYVGGTEYEVKIDMKSLCYKELYEFARDLYYMERDKINASLELKLHWLVPGKNLTNGLMYVGDDGSVNAICRGIAIGEMWAIFTEEVVPAVHGEDIVVENEVVPAQEGDVFAIPIDEAYSRQPLASKLQVEPDGSEIVEALLTDARRPKKLKVRRRSTVHEGEEDGPAQLQSISEDMLLCKEKFEDAAVEELNQADAPLVHKSDDEDSEYEPIPKDSLDDSEAEQLRKLAREIRKNERNKKLGKGTQYISRIIILSQLYLMKKNLTLNQRQSILTVMTTILIQKIVMEKEAWW
jgi:hypothetical protein